MKCEKRECNNEATRHLCQDCVQEIANRNWKQGRDYILEQLKKLKIKVIVKKVKK